MKDLGLSFIRRFTINYEQVRLNHFAEALKDDMIGVAGYAWPMPVNGLYPKTEGTFNHAFLVYKLPKYQVYDNYYDYTNQGQQIVGDFTKNLAPDYALYEYGYRVYLSAENVVDDTVLTVWQTLAKYGLTSFFADWYIRFQKTLKGMLKL